MEEMRLQPEQKVAEEKVEEEIKSPPQILIFPDGSMATDEQIFTAIKERDALIAHLQTELSSCRDQIGKLIEIANKFAH